MIRNASLFLALNYLKPTRSFISIITFLSVLGPILGVAVLIIVLAVMAGFNHDIRDKILGMQAHIQLKHVMGAPIKNPQPLIDKLKSMEISAAPTVEGPALIQTHHKVLAKYVRGIIPELEKNVSDIQKSVINGRFTINEEEVLVGEELARTNNLEIGDKILIHSPEKLNQLVKFKEDGSLEASQSPEVYIPEELTIVGIFSVGMFEYDSSILILHLDKADELFGLDWGSATSIQLKTKDPFALTPVIDQIRQDKIFDNLIPVTWQQANQRLFGALRVEKNLMFFLLIFIMIVASFGIAATLITVVIQKTREIGVLKAIGATPMTILLIFILQGAIVGFVGTVFGGILGLTVVHYRNEVANVLANLMGTEIFPKDLYHLSQIPALVQTSDVITIIFSAFMICVLGALIPAIYAATLTPSDALQTEI